MEEWASKESIPQKKQKLQDKFRNEVTPKEMELLAIDKGNN